MQHFGDVVVARGDSRKPVFAIGIGDRGGFIGIVDSIAVEVQEDGPFRKAQLSRTSLAVAVPVKPLGAVDSSGIWSISEIAISDGLPGIDRDDVHT